MPASTSPWKKDLPMWITLTRVAIVPGIIVFMFINQGWSDIVATLLFIIASITDYYDGYFARKYNAVSNEGKFLDPIADKILVSSVLILLTYLQRIDPIMVILVISRDTYIAGIRAIAATNNLVIDAKPTGKWKTALQMGSIPFIILGDQANLIISEIPLAKLAYFILWIAVLLSVLSGYEYYRAYKRSQAHGLMPVK